MVNHINSYYDGTEINPFGETTEEVEKPKTTVGAEAPETTEEVLRAAVGTTPTFQTRVHETLGALDEPTAEAHIPTLC